MTEFLGDVCNRAVPVSTFSTAPHVSGDSFMNITAARFPLFIAIALAVAVCSIAAAQEFEGSKAGDQKSIDGLELVWCPAGKYRMGSPPTELERRPGENQVEVTLTRGFWIGKYEATQGEWTRVVGAFPGVMDRGVGDRFPMYDVNFAQVEDFCAKFTEKLHASKALPADWEIRLPTEAQWEYACRAGTTTATAFGDSLSSTQANFLGHTPYDGGAVGPSRDRPVEVGSYAPNAWGLYDMHGNEYEWCRDWYHLRHPGGVDPDMHDDMGTRNESGSYSRTRKGGCWADSGWPCRSAFRLRFEPERGHSHIGFRVVAVKVR